MGTSGLNGVIDAARDLMTVRRVYGEAVERDGVTVIPAAAVRGGAGGGGGSRGDEESGSGGGFGLVARPSGAWIVRDGEVTWKPAVDVNRTILGGQVVGLVAILATARILLALVRRSAPPA